ncbi:ribokinase [Gracilibacillus oryzae]|uniref:Ribokinase n=1 Tax=Gracilibacillus oryzae TaxID=1672701 RepID=A0A7C8GSQ2_9BACI|nr:ribokinase [Gracilibacillus oryzae]KAB8130305.1 ribokinase [Gracilibacillus oryzae]
MDAQSSLKPQITVVGRINIEFITTAIKWEIPGKPLEGKVYKISPGGKGANQAIAASRFGGEVTFLGAVSADQCAALALENLQQNNVLIENVLTVPDKTTEKAFISDYENTVMIIEGANDAISSVNASYGKLKKADIVLMQNEIPIEAQNQIINYCHEHQIPVIYNPAPVRKLDKEMIDKLTFLTPNEEELPIMMNGDLYNRKVFDKIICTKGEKGVEFFLNGRRKQIPAYEIKAVDTTGAGDTFNGVLAVELAKKMDVEESIKMANLAAGIAAGKKGAQASMPTIEQVYKYMENAD